LNRTEDKISNKHIGVLIFVKNMLPLQSIKVKVQVLL